MKSLASRYITTLQPISPMYQAIIGHSTVSSGLGFHTRVLFIPITLLLPKVPLIGFYHRRFILNLVESGIAVVAGNNSRLDESTYNNSRKTSSCRGFIQALLNYHYIGLLRQFYLLSRCGLELYRYSYPCAFGQTYIVSQSRSSSKL
jgi:hypothetical protein